MADIKISAMAEATQEELTDSGLLASSVVDETSTTGYTTRKTTLAKLAAYILNTFGSLSLAGVAQTVKAAIDALHTSVTSHTDLLGSTSISGIGGGTVTGAISALNSDLAQSLVKRRLSSNVPIAINMASNVRGMILFSGAAADRCGIYGIATTTAGVAYAFDLIASSRVTFDTNTANKIIVTPTMALSMLVIPFGAGITVDDNGITP